MLLLDFSLLSILTFNSLLVVSTTTIATTSNLQDNNNAMNNLGVEAVLPTFRIPMMPVDDSSIKYQRCLDQKEKCQNDGICYESVTKPIYTFCRCHAMNYGEKCEHEDNNMYQKVLFGVSLLAGITLIVAVAASCQLYLKSGNVKEIKKNCEDSYTTSTNQRTKTLNHPHNNNTVRIYDKELKRFYDERYSSLSSTKVHRSNRVLQGSRINLEADFKDNKDHIQPIFIKVPEEICEVKLRNASIRSNDGLLSKDEDCEINIKIEDEQNIRDDDAQLENENNTSEKKVEDDENSYSNLGVQLDDSRATDGKHHQQIADKDVIRNGPVNLSRYLIQQAHANNKPKGIWARSQENLHKNI